ncbi:MAG: cell envelope integrity protein TolA, partial [Oceanospirillaceae bacterium]|nr:cell envelope integrity protein TolA [Oceanospirillaceae bacterium]
KAADKKAADKKAADKKAADKKAADKKAADKKAADKKAADKKAADKQAADKKAADKQAADKKAADKKAADKQAADEKAAEQLAEVQQALDDLLDDEMAADLSEENRISEGQAVSAITNYIMNEIVDHWVRPADARTDMVVYLEIKLVPTGEIVNVEIFSRNASASDAFVASAKTAALKVAKFDRLSELDIGIFDANFRNITLKFKPEDLRL